MPDHVVSGNSSPVILEYISSIHVVSKPLLSDNQLNLIKVLTFCYSYSPTLMLIIEHKGLQPLLLQRCVGTIHVHLIAPLLVELIQNLEIVSFTCLKPSGSCALI